MTNQQEVKIVVPIYREKLTSNEKISLLQCKRILYQYPICVIKPADVVLDAEEMQGIEIKEFDKVWFQSVQTYNALMLTTQFYEQFNDCKYILIYQLDAFVFRDELHTFCSLGYDYIGAPWLYGQFAYVNGAGGYYYVGNGGLSLRKVAACLEMVKEIKIKNDIHEDFFFASRAQEKFQIAPIDIALKFAFETNVKDCFEKNQRKLPFGCHAWQKYDFSFYKPLFQNMGYDISGIQDEKLDQSKNNIKCDLSKLSEKDFKGVLNFLLSNVINEIWIWGAGQLGKECGWLLLKHHIVVKGYIDSDVSKNRIKLYGKEVSSPSKYFEDACETPILIAIRHVPEEIRDLLYQNGKLQGRDYLSYEMLQNVLCEQFAE